MQNIYQTADLRQIEEKFASTHPETSLMERAGLAVAEKAREMIGDGFRILVVCGPGNNGGDGLVAARYLHIWGYQVNIVLLADDPMGLPSDAKKAFEAFHRTGRKIHSDFYIYGEWDLIIDALFGIGLTRAVTDKFADTIDWINKQKSLVLSIDIPSGLNSDTGNVLNKAVKANETISFIGLKPGLFTADGKDYVGVVTNAAIGVNAEDSVISKGKLLDARTIASYLPVRLENTHKGSNGNIAIIGGDKGMLGAVALAGKAALKMGGGRVYIGGLAALTNRYDFTQPELMWCEASHVLKTTKPNVVVIGPGLGQSETARSLLVQCLESQIPLVIDADALNIIASHHQLQTLLKHRTKPSILTPHPSEAARLLDCDTETIQHDRIMAATELAKRLNAHIVLKGSGTLCAEPSGQWFINPTGNAGLASAGTGDILSGAIGALIAQGMEVQKALLTAVFIHGTAADKLVQRSIGPIGLTATEVIEEMRSLINQRTADVSQLTIPTISKM